MQQGLINRVLVGREKKFLPLLLLLLHVLCLSLYSVLSCHAATHPLLISLEHCGTDPIPVVVHPVLVVAVRFIVFCCPPLVCLFAIVL